MAGLTLDHRSPAGDDFRCAVWTAGQGFDPVGSATSFDTLITVEVPQPWPSDVADLPWVAPLDVPAGVRVQAIVPESGRIGGDVLLTRWQRDGARLVGIDWQVPAPDVEGALQLLANGQEPAGDVQEAPPEILICSHGTRDRCCGGSGTRLTIETRAAIGDEIRVRRTSHLGGHRFAPTALTLPDGRMWAFLDAEAMVGIARRTMRPAEAREFYRGNVALDAWAQVVEAELLADSGWDVMDFDEIGATVEVGDDDRAEVELHWSGPAGPDQRRGIVEVADRYPVLQCGLPPSEAKKTAIEYRIA